MFAEDPVTGGIEYKEKGLVEVPETPGLGASVSEERLKQLPQVNL
jgi:L-alanine-DL-glutamate epimerase-like enolase superfamily enzyme